MGHPPCAALSVQMFVYDNPNPGLFERKVFGIPYVAVDTNAMRERDRKQKEATQEDYTRYQTEVSRRLRWCIDHGEEYWPAHEKAHLAPGDDSEFVFGVAPWMKNGSPNPLGIPDKPVIDGPPAGFELIPKWTEYAPDMPQMALPVKNMREKRLEATAVHSQKVTQLWKK